MTPEFALNLSHDGIGLLYRTAGTWEFLGEVSLEAVDFSEQLMDLQSRAARKADYGVPVTKLILPVSEVLYTTLTAPGPDEDLRRAQIMVALDGMTPYPVSDLVFDWCPTDDPAMVQVAVVARETLIEAETFAEDWGFNPASFVAVPAAGQFTGEPWFGQTDTVTAQLGAEETIDRDQDPVPLAAAYALWQEQVKSAPVAPYIDDHTANAHQAHGAEIGAAVVTAPIVAGAGSRDMRVPDASAALGTTTTAFDQTHTNAPTAGNAGPIDIFPFQQGDWAEVEDNGDQPISGSLRDAPWIDMLRVQEDHRIAVEADAQAAATELAAEDPAPIDHAIVAAAQNEIADISGVVDVAAAQVPDLSVPAVTVPAEDDLPAVIEDVRQTAVTSDALTDQPIDTAAEPTQDDTQSDGAAFEPVLDQAEPEDDIAARADALIPNAAADVANVGAETVVNRENIAADAPAQTQPETVEDTTPADIAPEFAGEADQQAAARTVQDDVAEQAAELAGAELVAFEQVAEQAAQKQAEIELADRELAEQEQVALEQVAALAASAAPRAATGTDARRAVTQQPSYRASAGRGPMRPRLGGVSRDAIPPAGESPLPIAPIKRHGPDVSLPKLAGNEPRSAATMALPPEPPVTAKPQSTIQYATEPDRIVARAAHTETAAPPAAQMNRRAQNAQPDTAHSAPEDISTRRGKPRYLGIILVAILVLCLAAVAAFADGRATGVPPGDGPAQLRISGSLSTAKSAPVFEPAPLRYAANDVQPTTSGTVVKGITLFAGRPSVMPPSRPATLPASAPTSAARVSNTAATGDSGATNAAPDDSHRPTSRPDNLAVALAAPADNTKSAPAPTAESSIASDVTVSRHPMPRPKSLSSSINLALASAVADEAVSEGKTRSITEQARIQAEADQRAAAAAAQEAATQQAALAAQQAEAARQAALAQAEAQKAAAQASARQAADQRAKQLSAAQAQMELPRMRQQMTDVGSASSTASTPKSATSAASRRVAAALPDPTDELDEPEPTSSVSKAPTSASVAKQATNTNAIKLRDMNLIGLYGSSSNRRALVRMPNGRMIKVSVGDVLDGGRVTMIGDGQLVYQKGTQLYQLKMLQSS